MATYRKLKLVSEEELDRIKQRQIEQYDPKLRIMARVQNQLENLLNSTDESLTANERLRLLEILQQRFRDMKKVEPLTLPPKPDVEAEIVPAAAVEDVAQSVRQQNISLDDSDVVRPLSVSNLTDTILSTISTRKRKDAKGILAEIAKTPNILNYNERLEAVVNGVPIPGSNFIRLFNAIFSSKAPPTTLVGFSEFQNALGNIKLSKMSSSPSSSVSASPPIASRTRTTSSRNPPPGTRANVLRVYDED